MSNHSNHDDPEMDRRMLEALNKATRGLGLGATGRFPEGKITKSDEGETRIAVAAVDGKVVIDLGKPTAWIGFTPELARNLAASLVKFAAEAEGRS